MKILKSRWAIAAIVLALVVFGAVAYRQIKRAGMMAERTAHIKESQSALDAQKKELDDKWHRDMKESEEERLALIRQLKNMKEKIKEPERPAPPANEAETRERFRKLGYPPL